MSAQFDDLLGDLEDSSTTSSKPTPNGDSSLLLDFTTSETPNGQADSNGVDFEVKSSSSNPLYDFDLTTNSSPSNPLYEFDKDEQPQPSSPQSSNPLYDLSSDFTSGNNNNNNNNDDDFISIGGEDQVPPPASNNPFADFENLSGGVEQTEDSSEDLLPGTNQPESEFSETSSNPASNNVDLLGDFTSSEPQQEYQPEDETTVQEGDSGIQEFSSSSEVNGNNSLVDFGSGLEVTRTTVQEEGVIEDSQTVTTKTTRTESSYSPGFEEPQEVPSNQWPKENSQESAEIKKETPKQDNSGMPEPTPRKQPVDIREEVMASHSEQMEYEEEEEEGVYENEPVKRADVVRESDRKEEVNMPSPGTAQNILAKFKTGEVQSSTPRAKREITPPNPTMGGGEYVSEPRVVMEQYEGRAESGVFESEPQYDPEIVRSGISQEEALPETGSAKKFAARYTQLDSERKQPVASRKKEITPDRTSGPVEYVSEPQKSPIEVYEAKAESGVFESQPEYDPNVIRSGEGVAEEAVPERGTAKNLAEKFRQISVENAAPVASRSRREITPEANVCKTDSGVFENTPKEDPEVVKSEKAAEEFVPERGYAKNVAARFKELESSAKSPPLSPGRRKEFTPPREDQGRTSGVYESTPENKPDVVTSNEAQQEVLPGAGTARSLAQRYKEIEAQNKSPVTSKPKKEFTPPPQENSVFENKPDRFQAEYNRPAESGILENQPAPQREDVLKGSDYNPEEALPETGSAKNLVNKWRQIESESAKTTSPGSAGARHKEFTPPRDEPRLVQNSKSPRTPKSPSASDQLDNGSVHPSELPGQYQPQNEPHVFESTPEPRPEALRESDTDRSQGMPKKNQAKKLLARFQSIQDEATKETPKPAAKKQDSIQVDGEESADKIPMENKLKFEDPDQVGRSKSMRAAIQVEKCGACDKTVYAMERLEMNKQVYHRACFRCSQCKTVLTPKTFAINNSVIFCTTHYKQNFKAKGNYDEGFGRQQHKKQWKSNPNIADEGQNDTGSSEAEVIS